MSVLAADDRTHSFAGNGPGIWQRLAYAFSANFADHRKRGVPVDALRRTRRDIEHCRRLLRGGVRAGRA
jgi:hypothetical protein